MSAILVWFLVTWAGLNCVWFSDKSRFQTAGFQTPTVFYFAETECWKRKKANNTAESSEADSKRQKTTESATHSSIKSADSSPHKALIKSSEELHSEKQETQKELDPRTLEKKSERIEITQEQKENN